MLEDISGLSDQIKNVANIGANLVSLGRAASSKGADKKYAESLNDTITKMNSAILTAQSAALTAQSAQASQSARIRELEQQIVSLEDWNVEKSRYNLVGTAKGTSAYAYLLSQEESCGDEPAHYICTRCYEHRIKSILQFDNLVRKTVCPECKTIFTIHREVASSHGVQL